MKFLERFPNKPVFGMIHLAHGSEQALKEVLLYEEHGLDGCIIENYHGSVEDVEETLRLINDLPEDLSLKISIGVNILPNEFKDSFMLANSYYADFIQLDHVTGIYQDKVSIDEEKYRQYKNTFKDIIVLGGVWPKYYVPIEGSDIKNDLVLAKKRADAIVVTGDGTGMETPLEKILQFREILLDFPLVIGAGSNPKNVLVQLPFADGVIVGSYLKNDDTRGHIDKSRLSEYMAAVKQARQAKSS